MTCSYWTNPKKRSVMIAGGERTLTELVGSSIYGYTCPDKYTAK